MRKLRWLLLTVLVAACQPLPSDVQPARNDLGGGLILAAYTQRLRAQFTTVGTGLNVYVAWATIEGTSSKVIDTDNEVSAVLGDASDYPVMTYASTSTQAADPTRMRKVLSVYVRNNALTARAIQFYMQRTDSWASMQLFTPAFSIPVGGMLEYSPETGWLIYNADGSRAETGPTGPQGAVGPAGANGTATTVEAHLGYTPKWTGTFTITDASITSTSKLRVWQANGPYTGKGTRADEAEMEIVDCIAYPATGSATVRWRSRDAISFARTMPQGGNSRTGLAVGTTTSTPPQDAVGLRTAVKRGAVWKNMKFTYQILG